MPFYTALATLLALLLGTALSAHAAMGRKKIRYIEASDAQKAEAERKSRAFGNFIEHTPLFLFALYVLEQQAPLPALAPALLSAFFFGRLCHAYSILIGEPQKGDFKGRGAGMALTYLSWLALAVALFSRLVA